MRLDEKADENLDAAERLLPDDSGREGLLNASVSRAYYAAYHAIAHRALRDQFAFTGNDYYRHDRLPGDALRWGIFDEDERDEIELLYGLRIKADHQEDQVDLEEASGAFDLARRLVTSLAVAAR